MINLTTTTHVQFVQGLLKVSVFVRNRLLDYAIVHIGNKEANSFWFYIQNIQFCLKKLWNETCFWDFFFFLINFRFVFVFFLSLFLCEIWHWFLLKKIDKTTRPLILISEKVSTLTKNKYKLPKKSKNIMVRRDLLYRKLKNKYFFVYPSSPAAQAAHSWSFVMIFNCIK